MARPYSFLVPSIDRRLSTWISLEKHRKKEAPPPPRPTVTLSRQYGCEGFILAERLKELFDARTGETWNLYDKALLEKVAADDKLSMQVLDHLGDASSRLDAIAFLFPGHTPHQEAFRHLPKYILEIAGKGNAVVIGRGGAIIAQSLKNCFHFRLLADFDFRVNSIMRRLEMSRKEAEKHVKENERTREKFIRDCLRADITDPKHYDAVFNNARHGVEEIAAAIVAYVARSWPGPGLFKS